MSNYIKKFSFTILILAVSYMNSSLKAMDTEDYKGSSIRIHKVSFIKEDPQDVKSSFTQQSTSPKGVNLENSENSWTSYVPSSVKTTVQVAKEFMSFSINNPKVAIVVGLTYIYPMLAAACECYCDVGNCKYHYIGQEPNISQCITDCSRLGCKFEICK